VNDDPRHVIVFADEFDTHADAVLYECRELGMHPHRVSAREIVEGEFECSVEIGDEQDTIKLKTFSLDAIDSLKARVFCRDLGFIRDFADPSEALRVEENWSWFQAWVARIPPKHWLDHYSNQLFWDNKLIQYQAAKNCGLRIPETLSTNCPTVAREFVAKFPSIIKQLSDVAFCPDLSGETADALYTADISLKDLSSDESIRSAPLLLQRKIEKAFDVRLYAIGKTQIAVKIASQTNELSRTDFRRVRELPLEAIDIPPLVSAAVDRLMKKTGLTYAAFDFAVDGSGNYFFLEFNVSGNWLWIELDLGLPIAKAIAKAIAKMDT